jgi:hypothetical protein
MSAKTTPAQPLVGLSLIARPGIAIRLLDGGLREIARGSGRLDTEQPQGLYLVEWSSAGQQSQTIVRVDGNKEREEVRFDPSARDSPDAFDLGRVHARHLDPGAPHRTRTRPGATE